MAYGLYNDFLVFNNSFLKDKLFPTDIQIIECVDRPYVIKAHLLSNYQSIPVVHILNQPASITINASETRQFRGIVTRFESGEIDYLGRREYYIELKPWLALLALFRFNRFYYNETIPNIVRRVAIDVCKKDLSTQRLVKKYTPQDCVIQFQENCLDFIHRLLAQAGMFYTFDFAKPFELPVLRDWPAATGQKYTVNNRGANADYLYDWVESMSIQPQSVCIQTRADRFSNHLIQREKQLGKDFVYKLKQHCFSHGIEGAEAAEDVLRYQVQRSKMNNAKVHFKSQLSGFSAGYSSRIFYPGNPEKEGSYMTLSVEHHAWDHSYHKAKGLMPPTGALAEETMHYHNHVTAIPNKLDYIPTRITAPKIKNVTTATVIAPEGRAVYTNQYDAVKVKYPWQADDNVNLYYQPWVRVAQWQAGKRSGSQFIPRAGDEVLVSFTQGNLLKPVITGSLYNQDNKTAYPLPKNKAITAIGSQVIGQNQGHEIGFDDTPKREVMRIKAQGRYNETTRNDTHIQVHGNETVNINAQSITQVLSGKSEITAGKASFRVGENVLEMDDTGIHLKGLKVTFKAKGVGGLYPVARLGDNHVCYQMSGAVPHQGGAINTGSSLLKVNNMPAARVDDTATCLPGNDTISEGVNSILVQGKPLSRVGHHTAHNGKILTGSPNVFVDEANFASHLAPGIFTPAHPRYETGSHWIQGIYPDKAGLSWRITHQSGKTFNGVLDAEGKTEKVTNLPQGNATITFGDKAQLEQTLIEKRADLKKQLEAILAASKAAHKKRSKLAAAWHDLSKNPNLSFRTFVNFEKVSFYTGEDIARGAVDALKGTVNGMAHLFITSAKWHTLQDEGLAATMTNNAQQYQDALTQAVKLSDDETKGITQAYVLTKLLFTDAQTRQILLDFAETYYAQTPGIVVSEQVLMMLGGVVMTIVAAVITKDMGMFTAEMGSSAEPLLAAASEDTQAIAKTLEALEAVRVIPEAQLDKVHEIERPDLVSAKAKLSAYESPADFLNARSRLKQSRNALDGGNCVLEKKYTDAELLALASQETAPPDNYMVRLLSIDAEQLDYQYPITGGMHTTWMTSFEQIEPYDTDPRLLTAGLGLPYDIDKQYTLLLMQLSGEMSMDATIPTRLFVPNFKNLTTVAKDNSQFVSYLNKYQVPIETLNEVMTPEYQAIFAEESPALQAELGAAFWNSDKVASTLKLKTENYQQRMARYGMSTQYGASEAYLGNGTTQYLAEGANNGALEYMFYDETGINLQDLQDTDKLAVIRCEPIASCPLIGVRK